MDKYNDIINRRILIIDDDVAIHAEFRRILTTANRSETTDQASALSIPGQSTPRIVPSSFELDYARQGNEGVERVKSALAAGYPYAVAFVDMHMPPGWDGAETVEHLWAVDEDLQVVICSAYSNYDLMQIIARLGHADKLLTIKMPAEPIEVLQCARALARKWLNERTVRRQMQALEQVVTAGSEGLEVANKQLRHLATHDPLTGLPNRVLLEDRLAQAMIHAERDGRIFALVMIDIDRLKLINDSFGYRAGDELLREVGRRMSGIIRDVDTLVRVGGDEFLMIIDPIAVPEDARLLAARAHEALKPIMRISGVETHCTASIGIAFFPRDATTIDSLMARAGAAMYCAKERGRNNAQCFESAMDPQTLDAAQLQSDLHEALEKKQFELHYQPKVDVQTGAVNSAEALIRWRHPERGLVSPGQFIPFAEDCGLIGPIGEWVVREACRQARAWQFAGLPLLRIAVNLSASQFRHGRLFEIVQEALNEAELDPTYLEVELTESAVMSDPEGSVKILEQLSVMGVLVSVDDFGTGYSSMSYLRRLPIDKLKIDRSFINEIATRSDDASIVRAIVLLAHSLNLKVVAEGVETGEQLAFLKSVGCDQYQGYYFSKALAPVEFEVLMRAQRSAEAELTQADMLRTHSKLSRYRAP
jgi:diguanylate cyclase (GGDEF)-like protein